MQTPYIRSAILVTRDGVLLAEAITRCIESIRLCLTVAVVYCFQAVPFVRTVLLSATGTAGSDLTKSASSRLAHSGSFEESYDIGYDQ